MATNNLEKYAINGPYFIQIIKDNFDDITQIKFGFKPLNTFSKQMMENELKVQYKIVKENGAAKEWSSWMFLNQLPVILNIGNTNKLKLFIKFKVPQSFKIKRGNYRGSFYLEEYQ